MRITSNGVHIGGMYKRAFPGQYTTTFVDYDGVAIEIDTKTIVCLYELVKFDLERRTGQKIEEIFPVEQD